MVFKMDKSIANKYLSDMQWIELKHDCVTCKLNINHYSAPEYCAQTPL